MTTLLTPISEQNVGTLAGFDEDVEPDAQWKEALRSRIEKELQSMADKVRQERDTQLRGASEGTPQYEAIMKNYQAAMDRVRRIAQDQFSQELKIARFERSLALGKEVEGEEFEAFRRQQQAIWEAIKKGGTERSQGRRDSNVASSSNQENGDPVAVPPRAGGEAEAREGPAMPYRDARSLARTPLGSESRPRDRTQSGGSDQFAGTPGSYGTRPARSRGNSSVFGGDFDPTVSSSPYDQGSIGRQSLSSLSRTRPQDIWLPSPSPGPQTSQSSTSRTFAHAAASNASPVSPNVPTNENGRTLSRAGSVRSTDRPSPVADFEAGSAPQRDRIPLGTVEERTSTRKGKEPDRSEHQRQPSFTQQTAVHEIYARRPDSRMTMPITPSRPTLASQTSEDQYFPQISPVNPRYRQDPDEGEGIPIRSSRRSVTSDQGSPENMRYGPPSSASARPIPSKRSYTGDFDAWAPQPPSASRPYYGPQSPPPVPGPSSSRPIPRPSNGDDDARRQSPSGAWHGSQSPPSALPFAGYDIPYSSSPHRRFAGSPAGSVSGRRNSNGSRSVRSRSSRQEFWGPSDVAQRPLPTYEEQSVASGSDSEEDYGMDLDDLWHIRERQELRERHALTWKLIQQEQQRQQRLAEEARRIEEEARRKEEEAARKEAEARRKEEEARRQAEEARKKEEEVRLKAFEVQQKAVELARREAELLVREAEAKLQEEKRKREEAEARLEEEKRRREEAEERRVREAAERREREKEDRERREREEKERREREERERKEREERERRERERREREERERREWEEKTRQEERERRAREQREMEDRHRRQREDEARLAQEKREWEEARKREEEARAAAQAQAMLEVERLRREEEEEAAAEAAALAEAEAQQEEARRRDEARKEEARQREEARKEEARQRDIEVQKQREAEARQRELEAQKKRDAEAQRRRDEEARRVRELELQREMEAKRQREEAEAKRRQEEEDAQRRVAAQRAMDERVAAQRAAREKEEAQRRREAEARQHREEEARAQAAEDAQSRDDGDDDFLSELQDPVFVREQQAELERIQAERDNQARQRAEAAKKREEEEARRQAQFKKEQEEIYKRLQAEEQGRLREQEARRRAEEEMRKKEALKLKQQDAILEHVLRQSKEEHLQEQERRRREDRRRQDSVGSGSDTNRDRPGPFYTASSSSPRPIPTASSAFHATPSAPGDRSSTASSSSFSSSASFFSASSGWSNSSGHTSASRASTTPTASATPTPKPATPSVPPGAKTGWKSTPSPATPTPTTASSTRSSGAGYQTAHGSGTSYTHSTPSTARAGTSFTASSPMNEHEWARRQEEHARRQFEQFQREQEAQQRRAEQKAMRQLSKEDVVKIFEEHERRWARLASMDVLSWHSFPWPMLKQPSDPEQLTYIEIQAYVLSPHQPGDKTSKERIKDYLRKWHPDRFETKVLPRVREDDREKVKEGAGTVARHLNKLLSSLSSSAENGLFG